MEGCSRIWEVDTLTSRWGADCTPHDDTEEVLYTVCSKVRGVRRRPQMAHESDG